MTRGLFILELIVLSIVGLIYVIARTGPERRAARQKGPVFEVALPPLPTEAPFGPVLLALLLVPCGLIGVLLYCIGRFDLSESSGLFASGVAVPLLLFGTTLVGLRVREHFDVRLARGRLRIDADALTWNDGSARGRVSFSEPFVLKRALAVEPHTQALYWVVSLLQKEKAARFFYSAAATMTKVPVYRWIDGTDGVFLGHHGAEVLRRLSARAERVEETATTK